MTFEGSPTTATDPPLLMRLPPVAGSVPDARRAVRTLCRSGGLGDVADDAEQLTSELMTNACRVADGDITLIAELGKQGVLVTVIDDSPDAIVEPSEAPDPHARDGRGLFLVDQLAGSWGVAQHPGRKAVWFWLP
jgi:anti-sigma regulatory factor (Ser/Thr protein kinase)